MAVRSHFEYYFVSQFQAFYLQNCLNYVRLKVNFLYTTKNTILGGKTHYQHKMLARRTVYESASLNIHEHIENWCALRLPKQSLGTDLHGLCDIVILGLSRDTQSALAVLGLLSKNCSLHYETPGCTRGSLGRYQDVQCTRGSLAKTQTNSATRASYTFELVIAIFVD